MKCFGKTLLVVLGLGVGVVGYGSSTAHAQAAVASSQLRVDLAGGFTVIRANEGPAVCGCFFMNGGSGELAVTNSHNISFVTNVGYTSQTNIGNIDRNLALLTVLEGGRYTLGHGRSRQDFKQLQDRPERGTSRDGGRWWSRCASVEPVLDSSGRGRVSLHYDSEWSEQLPESASFDSWGGLSRQRLPLDLGICKTQPTLLKECRLFPAFRTRR